MTVGISYIFCQMIIFWEHFNRSPVCSGPQKDFWFRSDRKVTDWNRWGRACAHAPQIDRAMLSCIPTILWGEEDPPAYPQRRRRRPIRTYKNNPSWAFYLPPCQLEEIWGTPWGNLNSYFWGSRVVSQFMRRFGLSSSPLAIHAYMLKAMYVIRFCLESLSLNIEDVLGFCAWYDAHVAYLLTQSMTVENLINREWKKTHVNCTLGLISPCWSVKINARFAEYIGWSFSFAHCHHRCRRYEFGCFDVVQWPINMLLFSDYVFISFTSPVCNIKKTFIVTWQRLIFYPYSFKEKR